MLSPPFIYHPMGQSASKLSGSQAFGVPARSNCSPHLKTDVEK